MRIRTSAITRCCAAALAVLLSLAGCSSDSSGGSDDGTTTTVTYYSMTDYTISSETGSVLADGITQSSYVMSSGSKANKLYVLDIDPSKNSSMDISVGLPDGAVHGLATASEMATYLDNYSGQEVIGGVNADFFDTTAGGPAGYTMHDGRWLTTGEYSTLDETSANHTYPGWAFGIKKDGSAIIAQPSITLSFDAFTGSTQDLDDVEIDALNQIRSDATSSTSQPSLVLASRADNDIVLYTPDFYSSTATADGGVEVIFSTSDVARSNGTISGTVTAVSSSTGNSSIAKGTMVLSGYGDGATALSGIEVGDTITISITVDSAWADVVECVGGGRHDGGPLLVEDGAIHAEDTTIVDYSSFYGSNPRTGAGVRADGSYFFFVVDGRQTGVSDGATIAEFSQFALDLGAQIAVNLDGGRSSTMITSTGTVGSYNLINIPAANGNEREDGNGIFVMEK